MTSSHEPSQRHQQKLRPGYLPVASNQLIRDVRIWHGHSNRARKCLLSGVEQT